MPALIYCPCYPDSPRGAVQKSGVLLSEAGAISFARLLLVVKPSIKQRPAQGGSVSLRRPLPAW